MLYLLDANVLIDANRDYYPLKRVHEFWEWLLHVGQEDLVKIPIEHYEEISIGKDELASWAKDSVVKSSLVLDEAVDVSLCSYVIDTGYAPDLTDDEVEKIGRDPFLIAYTYKDKKNRCLVTTEVSKPSKLRANRHVPDVCNDLKIYCCDTFKFLRILDFRTDWNVK